MSLRVYTREHAAVGPWVPGRDAIRVTSPLFQSPKPGRPSGLGTDDVIRPAKAPVADVRTRSFLGGTPPLQTRVAGIFAFWPLLAQLGFGELVERAGYPGSGMVPATSAVLSLLALKLIDKERRSHISDFDFDEALGVFAGLNVLPKATFATDYSYRTVRENQQRLLAGWVSGLLPRLDPEPNAFSLDFHSIPHRGEDNGLENHYVPMRGKAVPSVLTFFAQAVKSRLLCYADATVDRERAAGQLLKFVDFCQSILGAAPTWVYFDSRFTTYCFVARKAMSCSCRLLITVQTYTTPVTRVSISSSEADVNEERGTRAPDTVSPT